MRRTRVMSLVAGLVGALALSSCSIYDVQLPGGADVGNDPIKVKILFRDVLDLVPQSTVKVDDVTVGKVTKIELKGYIADVTVALPKNTDLPANTRAEIRQTSLLGEKFVSLSKPSTPEGQLRNGDTIGLEDSGRNPEIEEVFGALALVLNGGGVGQLKTISEELNQAFEGREQSVRSIITQVSDFMGQLDANKVSIVTALENLNRLSLELRRQDGTIKDALDDLPAALSSVNGQRADLVKMLKALSNLSSVGVDVIKASKESTIDALNNLAPVLTALGKAGESFPKSLQVALTYPFIDEAVGRDPEVARNLHMGDFTNLSINLSLDLFNLPNVPGLAPGVSVAELLGNCGKKPDGKLCTSVKNLLSGTQLQQVCKLIPALCKGSLGNGGGGQPVPGIGGVPGLSSKPPVTGGTMLDNLIRGLTGALGRTATGAAYDPNLPTDPFLLAGTGYDPGLGTLLLQGVATK
ncbi:MCE family protein [Nocardioides marmoriginsengisoli]|uniref:MCE family protein n=1 Tax=Nocardioides marmoriginsengisoli TaxID=661483 RepID=A0A3N0CCE9_9ACTN|nr:MCE family protein [Nocardioides marmoriginsengisoli]RNL61130.1 MCE family protein [Nocardioides marmoriginsengisoli]